MANKLDTDLVCTTCRWRAGHSPDCPRKDEPWPTIEVPEAADEITRLNAENERLRLHCANYEATMRVIGESSESAELARLNALVDEMREGLEQAAGWFEEYATQHYAKARTAPDGREQHGREIKGKVNADRAKELRALITKASRDSGHG